MKAILVVDMPSDCNECRLNSNGYCDVLQEYALLNEWVEDAPYYSLKEKGVCPLKPMPEKIEEGEEPNIKYGISEYAVGRNDCIDEILGETE